MPGREGTATLLEVSSMITVLRAFSTRGDLQHIRHQISAHQSLKTKCTSFYCLFIMKEQTGGVECACRRKDGVPLTGSTRVRPKVHCRTFRRQSLRDRMICRDQSCCADTCKNPPLCRIFINTEWAGPDVLLIQENVRGKLSREIAPTRLWTNVEITITGIRLRRRYSGRRL